MKTPVRPTSAAFDTDKTSFPHHPLDLAREAGPHHCQCHGGCGVAEQFYPIE